MARGRITKVTPTTKTCASNSETRSAAAMFPRNLDRGVGADQALVRVDARAAQGQKKTPIGAGKLTRGR
jgi:hypothetical protein